MAIQVDTQKLRRDLLAWYDREGRTLPWRVRPEDRARGVVPDPYAVWLSEVMSQQTTLAHATPYWRTFLDRYPTVTDLANAAREDVLGLWAGLGYYARARNLHKCAQSVRDDHGGQFPDNEAALLTLPGIGPYTAAAIAAICFDQPTNVVDGNVERVITRLFAVETPLPKAKSLIRALAGSLADPNRPGEYAQALMDLGATICRPQSPACLLCPWSDACTAHAAGNPTDYPRKLPKRRIPVRHGNAFVLTHGHHVRVERRPDSGLLGGMTGFPGSGWGEMPEPGQGAPVAKNWRDCGEVHHTFTHFKLSLRVFTAEAPDTKDGDWTTDISALPTVFKKVYRAVHQNQDGSP